MTLAELFERCKCGVYLEVNAHRDHHQSVIEYVADHTYNHWRECPPIVADACVGDTLFDLQFHPDTPLGFFHIVGSSLDAVLAAAHECLDVR